MYIFMRGEEEGEAKARARGVDRRERTGFWVCPTEYAKAGKGERERDTHTQRERGRGGVACADVCARDQMCRYVYFVLKECCGQRILC